MPPLFVNARVLAVPSNGQKRVAQEVLSRMPEARQLMPAPYRASGLAGHLWEQSVLHALSRKGRLWSPSTSGPVWHPNHIVTIHDIAFVDGREWFSPSFAKMYDQITRQTLRHARHIITVSEFTRRRLIEHYRADPDKVRTIYSGVSRVFAPQPAPQVAEVLDRIGVTGPYLVAFLGADPRKNTASVLRAWAELSPRFPDARLVTFGRLSNPRVFADGLPHGGARRSVVHAGPVNDPELACLYSGASGLVFPSLYEGFGLPVLEAAACGCRVLASRTSALPEVSPPDAMLVDPLSLVEIKDAMGCLLDSPDEASAKGPKTKGPDARAQRVAFSGDFSWERAVAEYRTVFDQHFR